MEKPMKALALNCIAVFLMIASGVAFASDDQAHSGIEPAAYAEFQQEFDAWISGDDSVAPQLETLFEECTMTWLTVYQQSDAFNALGFFCDGHALYDERGSVVEGSARRVLEAREKISEILRLSGFRLHKEYHGTSIYLNDSALKDAESEDSFLQSFWSFLGL
jgi:hypothetical protein